MSSVDHSKLESHIVHLDMFLDGTVGRVEVPDNAGFIWGSKGLNPPGLFQHVLTLPRVAGRVG